ncbi:MAG: putative motility protein [Burkholderiales bacterium]
MDAVNSATVANASSASLGTVQGAASVLVLKKSMDQQASAVAQLIAALPQPALATSGSLGTKVNTFA